MNLLTDYSEDKKAISASSVCATSSPGLLHKRIGSLSNDDGDVNEDGKKAIGLDWQNKHSARAPRFFLNISLPSLHDHNVKMPNFTFCGRREHKTTTSF